MKRRVKTAVLIIAGFMMLTLPGCGRSGVSEQTYSLVWQLYTSREFEEGFFEKLSSEQKKKIFFEAADKAGADIHELSSYMKDRYPQAYSQILE